MTAPDAPASLADLPLASEPTRVEPVGRIGALSSLGAALGIIALAVATWLAWPLQRDLAAIRGEDETARAAPTLASLGHAAPVRDDARAEAVRAAVLPVWAARERELLPFLAPRAPTGSSAPAPPDQAGIVAWAELRRAFATALAAHGLAAEEYALTARARPAPFDALLVR